MSGRRRVQRSVRLVVAVCLLVVVALLVVASVVTATFVTVAALIAVVGGIAAARIVYAELLQTRRDHLAQRADLARAYRESLTSAHADHVAFADTMKSRVRDRDTTITELHGTIALAERRVGDAEARVLRESKRANAECERADEAQERLAAVLEEVLGTSGPEDVDADRAAAGVFDEAEDFPTVVDLLGWESGTREHMDSNRKLA